MVVNVDNLLKTLSPPDMLRIVNEDHDIYVGYMGMMQYHDRDLSGVLRQEVKSFRCIPEIRHRQWKEKGLDAPMRPDVTPNYAFADLQMTLYYTIYI